MLSTYRFAIKRPFGKRKTYDIVCDKKNSIERVQKTIKKIEDFKEEAAALDVLNNRISKMREVQIEAELSIIIQNLKNKVNNLKDSIKDSYIEDSNMNLFKQFWKDKYSQRKIIDKNRAYNSFIYSLRILGSISIQSANQENLQKVFDKKLKGTAHRRYARCTNALLKYSGRDFQLQVEPLSQPEVRFISIESFKVVLESIEDEKVKWLTATLFACGCRTSEAFALNSSSLKGDISVYISHQIDRKLNRRETKNRIKHDALIIRDFIHYVNKWISLSQEEKNTIRISCAKDIPSIFRNHKVNITAHDLRHSYANHLILKGIPLDRVAQFLGDSIEVCERHYRGWIVEDKVLKDLSNILNSETEKNKILKII